MATRLRFALLFPFLLILSPAAIAQTAAPQTADAGALNDAVIATVEKQLSDTVMSRQDELLRIQAIEYARHFDEPELRDLAAFYRTPLGQKYIQTAPAIVRESAPIVQQWMRSVIEQAQQQIMQSLPKQQNDKS